MRLLYVDTGALLALLRARDDHHRRVRAHFDELRREGARLVTGDIVIAETATRLRYDTGLHAVLRLQDRVQATVAAGALRIRDGDDAVRRGAFAVMEQYADLTLSYGDAVGAVVAREMRADAVFGLDNVFRVMGFTVEP